MAVVRALSGHFAALGASDVAARCATGTHHDKTEWAKRKREVTAQSSSRWAGRVTKHSNDVYATAKGNQKRHLGEVERAIEVIAKKLDLPVHSGAERKKLLAEEAARAKAQGRKPRHLVFGYRSETEHYQKRRRLQHLVARADRLLMDTRAGRVHVALGGPQPWMRAACIGPTPRCRLRHRLAGSASSRSERRGSRRGKRLAVARGPCQRRAGRPPGSARPPFGSTPSATVLIPSRASTRAGRGSEEESSLRRSGFFHLRRCLHGLAKPRATSGRQPAELALLLARRVSSPPRAWHSTRLRRLTTQRSLMFLCSAPPVPVPKPRATMAQRARVPPGVGQLRGQRPTDHCPGNILGRLKCQWTSDIITMMRITKIAIPINERTILLPLFII